MPKKGKSGGKKGKAFQDDPATLQAFHVEAKGLVKTTSLGLTATVVGVKMPKEGEQGEGTLFVDYRMGFRSPVEKDTYEACSSSANLKREAQRIQSVLEMDQLMKDTIHDLNAKFKAGLIGKEKKKKK